MVKKKFKLSKEKENEVIKKSLFCFIFFYTSDDKLLTTACCTNPSAIIDPSGVFAASGPNLFVLVLYLKVDTVELEPISTSRGPTP